MARTFLLVGLLAWSAASAQTVKLSYPMQESETYRFNASQCQAEIQVQWDSSITFGLCSELKLWSTDAQCGEKPGPTDLSYDSVPQSELAFLTGTFQVKLAELPGFKSSDAGVVCGSESVEKTHRLCGSVSVNSTTNICTIQTTSSLTAIYDTLPPVAPTIESVAEQDGALTIKFTAHSDTSVVHFDTRAQGTTAFVEKADIATISGSSIRISGLTNGTTYDLQARAEDAASNFSAPSELVSATPRLTKGFWARYRDAGGAQTGGCQAVHGLPLLLAGGLWLLRRKRNR